MPSLLRTEAVKRAADLRIDSVLVELDLGEPAADVFGSRTTIAFASTSADTFVDFRGRELVSATLNGHCVDPGAWADGRLALTGLEADNILVVDGRMAYSSDGEGLHRHVDPADGLVYLYAMSFLDAGPRWFACFDQPDLKASYRFDVTVPPDWTVLGNGPATAVEPGRWTIVPPRPLSTYFVTLVAGPYASVHAEHDGIPLGFHARASLRAELEAEAPDMITVTAQCFDYYHRLFGVRYPFGEYHQAFVPDFNAGAMENPGCVTFRDQLVFRSRATEAERGSRASVIAHEMAHQWFGDLVTMRWWDDLWLNESFAEYLAHRCCSAATRYLRWTEFGIRRKDWGAVADQAPSTHPVAGNGAADAAAALQDFDGISYAKGAAVLRQLAGYLGEKVFMAGLRSYFTTYAFGNAEFAELIGCWTDAGATGLEEWAAAWLQTAGMDTLDVLPGAKGATITATGPDGRPSPRVHAVTVGSVDASGAVSAVADLRLERSADLPLPPASVLVVPDAGDATWAKVRFGSGSWPSVAAVLPAVVHEPTQVVLLNALRDAVRDATLDSEQALTMVLGALPHQASDDVVAEMFGFAARSLAGPFSPPEQQAERLGRVHATALSVLGSSGVGSDRQLIAFRVAVATAVDRSLLQGWYAGAGLPDGVRLDQELTWAVVVRSAALGNDTIIEEALGRDPSSAAAVHAARARASLPSEEAKAAAWRLMMQPSAISAYETYAAAQGFWVAGQQELTRPYVARYFDEIGATAGFRNGWALARLAEYGFPRLAVDPDTVVRAEATLAGELPRAVRRAVVDALDQLRRALTSLQQTA